ncbi:MAG: matrixin family metalloprotease [Clostridia bacterium]|nr:matrixin family metalloprotease [Clostridia bacterium]
MKKIKILLSFSIILSMLMCTQAFAVELYGKKLSRGISNFCYYVDSSASSYTSAINSAKNRWSSSIDDNCPFNMTAVSSSSGSTADYYGKSSSYFGQYANSIIAETQFYSSSSVQVSPYSTNWFYTETFINKGIMPSNSTSRITVMAHELGHTFGLDDSTHAGDIMYENYESYFGDPGTGVTIAEYNAVLNLYGYEEVSK